MFLTFSYDLLGQLEIFKKEIKVLERYKEGELYSK